MTFSQIMCETALVLGIIMGAFYAFASKLPLGEDFGPGNSPLIRPLSF